MSSSLNFNQNFLFEDLLSYSHEHLQTHANTQQCLITSAIDNHQNQASTHEEVCHSYVKNYPKESNPNLLKNLVVTLKCWISFKEEFHSEQVMEIWKYFKNCKKINRHLVWNLYGNIMQNPEDYDQIIRVLPCLAKISVTQFSQIQKEIRMETAQQLRQINLDYILKYKRVKNLEQFGKYFYCFVEGLQKGDWFPKKGKK